MKKKAIPKARVKKPGAPKAVTKKGKLTAAARRGRGQTAATEAPPAEPEKVAPAAPRAPAAPSVGERPKDPLELLVSVATALAPRYAILDNDALDSLASVSLSLIERCAFLLKMEKYRRGAMESFRRGTAEVESEILGARKKTAPGEVPRLFGYELLANITGLKDRKNQRAAYASYIRHTHGASRSPESIDEEVRKVMADGMTAKEAFLHGAVFLLKWPRIKSAQNRANAKQKKNLKK